MADSTQYNDDSIKSGGGFEDENPEAAAKLKKKSKRSKKKQSDRSLLESPLSTTSLKNGDDSASDMKPKSKRKKKRNSASSVGSSGFVTRLETSLVHSVEFSIAENKEFAVIDVEEEMELNRKKEKERKKMKKKKNKRDGVDPRLFPSYYDKEKNFQDEASEISGEFGRTSFTEHSGRSFSGRSYSYSGRSFSHSGRSITNSNRTAHQIVTAVQGRKIVQLGVIVPPKERYGGNEKKKALDFSKALSDSQKEGVVRGIRPHKDITSFSSPIRLLEIEEGQAILVKGSGEKIRKSRVTMSVAAVKQTRIPKDPGLMESKGSKKAQSLRKRISDGVVRGLQTVKPELAVSSQQNKLRRLLVWSMDNVNALNLGKQIQSSIPFLSGYESYLLGQVVEVLLESVVSGSNGSKSTGRRERRKAKTELNAILGFAFKNHNVSRIIVENVDGRWDFSWHWFQQLLKSRRNDAWGRLPFVGITRFPETENFPTAGDWKNKFLIADSDKIIAQNLSAECNGFEETKRNQYGTYIGRSKTNDFRIANRLPVDESIVHTFVVSPMSTMINNGVVHVLRQMAKHWRKILEQPLGNFAHHRLELLDPFETMRFQMPNVCVVLSSLRGRNIWDSRVLGPFLRKCQNLTTSFTSNECLDLAKEMQLNIVPDLCGGVVAIEKPLYQWLEAIQESCHAIEDEAKEIYKEITGVEIGLQFGHDVITQVSWKMPSDTELEKAILLDLQGKYSGELVHEHNIRGALISMTPRDKRTLIELCKLELEKSEPAKVLMERVKNLLKRDIRREFLNDAIRELSTGQQVFENDLIIDDWYWLNEENDKKSVYIFEEEELEDELIVYRFVRADSGEDRVVSFEELETAQCRRYIPVAESIVRAQRCYMNIELDYCHKFKYSAFAEFAFLRTALNRLAVISQIFCYELDNARLNILREIKAMNQVKVEAGDLEPGKTYYIYNSEYDVYAPFVCKKKFSPADPEWQKLEEVEMVKVLPQSTIVVGSDVTALMTAIHCVESVLASGGDINLYENSDKIENEGAVFERAQIVNLDPRWVAMLRYHLGTAFEETFIPTSFESNAHLGNNLATEGFVETTLKDLECILHAEVTRLWSKEILQVKTGSKVFYDAALNSLVKIGDHLEVGDKVLRRVDPFGKPSKQLHRWTIAEVQDPETLEIGDLRSGEEYGVYVKREKAVLPFKLTEVDLYSRTYKFESLMKKAKDIEATPHNLPSIYPKGSKRLSKTVTFKCDTKGDSDDFYTDRLSEALEGMKSVIDIGRHHIVECIGMPDSSPHHFEVTSSEPFGFCCISRLNRSIEHRGILGRFNSINVHNTRIIGDSIKMVRQLYIANEMANMMATEHWQKHFMKLIEDSEFSSLNDTNPIVTKLCEAAVWHKDHAPEFRRQNLQIKLSETVDNFYLGMELTREYEKWKNETVDQLLSSLKGTAKNKRRYIEELKTVLRHNIDLLWFEACLEVVRSSGVYTELMHKIPRMHLINHQIEEDLTRFSVGDSFRVVGKLNRKWDILLKKKKEIFARNADGFIQKFHQTTNVFREGCLSRSTDGDTASKVAIATFPVSHHVNHRAISLSKEHKGYVFASIGDEQSTPHFMHYSGLTGGCINAVQFNHFLRSAIKGVSLTDRLQLYSKETDWSNREVVQRGIMNSFGQDAFLRPGFSYKQGLKYIYSLVVGEKQNHDKVLFEEWRTNFVASMIPRGMELNNKFIKTLKDDTDFIIFDLFLKGAMDDDTINWKDGVEASLKARKDRISKLRKTKNPQNTFWQQFFEGLTTSLDEESHKRLELYHGEVVKRVEKFVSEVIDFAKESYLYDRRSSQELWNQPKPVDSLIDDFAADGRNLPSSLAQSTALCAASVALVLYASRFDNYLKYLLETCGVIISVINIFISAGTLLNTGKYKTRNGQARHAYFKKHFLDLKKSIYNALDTEERKNLYRGDDPYLEDLETKKKKFVADVVYYGLEVPEEFIYDYRRLMEQSEDAAAFRHFQKLLATYYIPDVYQENSYVQESLVEVYKVCDEIHALLARDVKKSGLGEREHCTQMFLRVTRFGPRLQQSIDSSLLNSNFFLACRYFWSLIFISSSTRALPFSAIENETYGIMKGTKTVSENNKGSILKRQIHDLHYLHRAMLETDKGAVVFFTEFLVFVASCLFAISRIVAMVNNNYLNSSVSSSSVLSKVGIWSQLASIFVAFMSLRYFACYLGHSLFLWVKLRVKNSDSKSDKSMGNGLRRVKGFVSVQLLLAATRILAILGSFTALSWCIAELLFDEQVPISEFIPFLIALVAFCLAIGTPVLFYLVEDTMGYHLPPKLGEVICEAFRDEIESMYEELSIPENKFDTKQSQERVTWEYVAQEFLHKYKFDAIFGPDRCGSILQYLQSGLKKREKLDEDDNC